MKQYITINDIPDLSTALQEITKIKASPFAQHELGKGKTLGLFFFNSSLRTRLSTEKAAKSLGMEVLSLNVNSDSWQLEFDEGIVMDGNKAEHIKEAAKVLSQYCDILAIRAFPELQSKKDDEAEHIINAFAKYATVPIVNLESSTAHPLQGLTDAFTIRELTDNINHKRKPKVVLSWAPHPKALPHAVPNSFIRTLRRLDVDLSITHPPQYHLNPEIIGSTPIAYDQQLAFDQADIVYVKNWSSYEDYGQVKPQTQNWMITAEKMTTTANAKVMHCLPVRRNVVIADEVLDAGSSAV